MVPHREKSVSYPHLHTAHYDELWNFYDQKTNYTYFMIEEIIFISSCSSFLN